MGTSLPAFVNVPCAICGERFDVRRDSPEFWRDPFVCVTCKPITHAGADECYRLIETGEAAPESDTR